VANPDGWAAAGTLLAAPSNPVSARRDILATGLAIPVVHLQNVQRDSCLPVTVCRESHTSTREPTVYRPRALTVRHPSDHDESSCRVHLADGGAGITGSHGGPRGDIGPRRNR
jgi:hypothetical protein